jgi:predicted dehydrogenase
MAIVGLGSIGRRHLRLLREVRPEIEVTLVRSGNGPSCAEESLAHRTVPTVAAAIEAGAQASVVATPSPFHVPQALELAAAGCHVLVEKPLSNSYSGVIQLQRLVAERNVVALVGYVLRYDPAAQHFASVLRSGDTGDILHSRIECGSYLPDWRPGQDFRQSSSALEQLGGGVLLELSHELDYANWFFGTANEVQARLWRSENLGISVEDSADLLLLSSESIPISVNLDFNRRRSTRCCVVQCTEGELTWDVLRHEVRWHSADGEFERTTFEVERDDVYRQQLEHFLRCIEEGETPIVSLQDGIDVLKTVEAARRSDTTGERVRC